MELYDEEIERITNVVNFIQDKWRDQIFSAENLDRMHKEIVGRLEDAGFYATVDLTPMFEYLPVDISITGRVNELKEFDYDKKIWEVKKSRAEGGN